MSFIDTVRGWFSPVVSDEEAMVSSPAMPAMRFIEIRAFEPRSGCVLPSFRGITDRPHTTNQSEARIDRTRAQARNVFGRTQPVTEERVPELAALARTLNGWFSIEGQKPSAQILALIKKFGSAGPLERHCDPTGDGNAPHFIDKGLTSYLWILAARFAHARS